jgi:hypothetical protein
MELPDAGDAGEVEGGVGADELKAAGDGLGCDHAVKGVAVMKGQGGHDLDVLRQHGLKVIA